VKLLYQNSINPTDMSINHGIDIEKVIESQIQENYDQQSKQFTALTAPIKVCVSYSLAPR
jgi:hypothetical protein